MMQINAPCKAPQRQFRVLIADDRLIGAGLKYVLGDAFDITCAYDRGRDLVAEADRLQPDIVVLDVFMRHMDGMDAARQIHTLAPHVKLIFFTDCEDAATIDAAFSNGAAGYLLRRSPIAELRKAVASVLGACFFITSEVRSGIPNSLISPHFQKFTIAEDSLTPRQREVLHLVAEGKALTEIAHTLGIAPEAVAFHQTALMRCLRVSTTAQLARRAVTYGLLPA